MMFLSQTELRVSLRYSEPFIGDKITNQQTASGTALYTSLNPLIHAVTQPHLIVDFSETQSQLSILPLTNPGVNINNKRANFSNSDPILFK